MNADTRTPARWWTAARCRDVEDTTIFFPERSVSKLAAARQVCEGCPVRRDCYQDARARGERDGVWGGVLFT